jgi:parvulin-like peptidyl-prolyl isomerase
MAPMLAMRACRGKLVLTRIENAGSESMVTKARKARKVREASADINPAILEDQLEEGRQSFMSLYKVTKQLQRENKKLRMENARFRSRIAKLTAR